MGKLCAPVRDEKIASLTKTTNVVEVFRGILETIDLMKLDMANFTINVMRPQIVANSVEYEKMKFAEYLKLDPGKVAVPSNNLFINMNCTSPVFNSKFSIYYY